MKLLSNCNFRASWDQEQIDQLHIDIVTDFLKCDDDRAEKATVEFVKFLNHKGLNIDNYPFYMELFFHENEKVIQALLSDGKVLNSLKRLQRSRYLIDLCFRLLKRFSPATVYQKTLETLLIILKMNYGKADSGFKVYALENEDLNYLGKFLDKSKPQASKINRIILDILADIGELKSKDVKDGAKFEIGSRANRIRNAFFDKRSSMEDVIAENMLGK